MLKLTASYSKKVPVQGQDYSSQSYHAAVEVEIPDGLSQQQLDERIHDTFALVKDSVETELTNGDTRPVRRFEPTTGNRGRTQARRDAGDKPGQSASGKQIGYLRDIATRQGLTSQQLDDEAGRMFGVDGVDRLTRQEASRMIDTFNSKGTSVPRRKAA